MRGARVRWASRRLWVLVSLALVATAASATPLPAARPEAEGFSAERLARLRKVMQGYVDRNELPGLVTLILRDGKIVDLSIFGMQDVDKRQPMRADTIFRLASMSKVITSVAVMMLYDEGRFLLTDPISRYIPSFKSPKVLVRGKKPRDKPTIVPAEREITIRDLLTHRSGLSYRFSTSDPVDNEYRKLGVPQGTEAPPGTVGEAVEKLAKAPLVAQPGKEWHYGLSVDVLGRLVEVVSGMTLEEFLAERIFRPLQMVDTGFTVPEAKWPRFATAYTTRTGGGIRAMQDLERFDKPVSLAFAPWRHYRALQRYFSGGAGLVSTARDYARFVEMLRRGGELEGVRLLGPKTVELMTVSHSRDLPRALGNVGYDCGLGVNVLMDLGASQTSGSVGSYMKSGAYGTFFWVDPKNRLVGVLMTQRYPDGGLDWKSMFEAMTYQALVRP